MFFRATLLASLLCLPFLGGCSTCEVNTRLQDPPGFQFKNPGRLVDEIAWFYADIQDMIFGIDYYCEIERKYGGGPYHTFQ